VWKLIKDWEIREWLTLVFAAAATVIPWVVHRYRIRKASDAAASIWSIHIQKQMPIQGDYIWAELKLEQPDTNRFHLVSLDVSKPRKARLTRWKNAQDAAGKTLYVPDPPEGFRVLTATRDLTAHRTYGSQTRVFDYATFAFLLKMPPRPWFSRSERTRAVVTATVEEISSRRRLSRVPIITPPIEWAAKRGRQST
jgi:hypothetical protein